MKNIQSVTGWVLCVLCAFTFTHAQNQDRQLIVVALPGGADAEHYRCELGNTLAPLCRFYEAYAQAAATVGDEFLIVYPKNDRPACLDENALPPETHVIGVEPRMYLDIWIRDFAPVHPNATHYGKLPVKYWYEPGYLPWRISLGIDTRFWEFMVEALAYAGVDDYRNGVTEQRFVMDGGNMVDTDHMGVATWRVYRENRRRYQGTRQQKRQQMKADIRSNAPTTDFNLCMIPDPNPNYDTTGHADGRVSFLDDHTLAVAHYGPADDQDFQAVWNQVTTCFPGINIIRINSAETDHSSTCSGAQFTSALGSTVNILSTTRGIYIPTFNNYNNGEIDNSQEIQAIRDAINQRPVADRKTIVTVEAGDVAHMGGSVRCLSWQLASDSLLATGLRNWANSQP